MLCKYKVDLFLRLSVNLQLTLSYPHFPKRKAPSYGGIGHVNFTTSLAVIIRLKKRISAMKTRDVEKFAFYLLANPFESFSYAYL
jgi:hypothetical protein